MTDQTDRPDASASADPASPAQPAPESSAAASPPPPAAGADLDRRRFFRQFAGEIANTAATMVGTVQALQRTSAELAGSLLDPNRLGPDAGVVIPQQRVSGMPAATAPPEVGFRTSFRVDGSTIRFIDQRALPREVVEHASISAAEVSWAIRNEVVQGGPAIGQAAAIGMALTAGRVSTTRPYARRATLRGAANALANTDPTHASIRWAVDRVMRAYRDVGELSEDGAAIADAMTAEADRIIGEVAAEHGRLVEAGVAVVDALPRPETGPLRLLVHGQSGTLAGGQLGTALSIAIAAHHAEHEIRVIVPEARPSFAGSRITCWELAGAGVAHLLIADAAAPAIIAAGDVDAILVPADRVAANGDVAAAIGSYALAVVAARHGVPFIVCAPTSSIDVETPTGSAITIGSRPAADLERFRDVALAPHGTEINVPVHDITPAELVTRYLTADGARATPFGEPVS
jgi:methylthioribose-1-phosphate isomerase